MKQAQKYKIEWTGDTVGDTIKALVKHFTGQTLGDFVLEKALRDVKENNQKIEAYTKSLLEEKEEVA